MLMHAIAASCEELRARTGNPPLHSMVHYLTNYFGSINAIGVRGRSLEVMRGDGINSRKGKQKHSCKRGKHRLISADPPPPPPQRWGSAEIQSEFLFPCETSVFVRNIDNQSLRR